VPTVLKCMSLNLLEPSGPVQACNGRALPLPLPLFPTNAQSEGTEVCRHSFFKLGDRWAVNDTPRPLYHRERDTVPPVHESGWALGPVLPHAENLATAWIRLPDRPAHSELLRLLHYRGCAEVKSSFFARHRTPTPAPFIPHTQTQRMQLKVKQRSP